MRTIRFCFVNRCLPFCPFSFDHYLHVNRTRLGRVSLVEQDLLAHPKHTSSPGFVEFLFLNL
jgi:hypothetical protein